MINRGRARQTRSPGGSAAWHRHIARSLLLGAVLSLALALSQAAHAEQDGDGSAEASTGAGGISTPASEVERLRQLLRRHEETASATEDAMASDSRTQGVEAGDAVARSALEQPYSADKVLLSSSDLPLMLGQVQRRLDNPLLEDRRNNTALVGALQTRRGGALVASSSFGLRHIGRHQFLGRSELQPGRNALGISGKQWQIDLSSGEPGVYLVLLFAPPLSEWELHVIPEQALETLDAAAPDWLSSSATESGLSP